MHGVREAQPRRASHGYRRLKDALLNQKSSNVFLLDRATMHIKYLEMTQQELQTRLAQAPDDPPSAVSHRIQYRTIKSLTTSS